MSLYTAAQTEAINKLSKHPKSSLHTLDLDLPDWEGFRKSFWGPNSVPFQEETADRDGEPVNEKRIISRFVFELLWDDHLATISDPRHEVPLQPVPGQPNHG